MKVVLKVALAAMSIVLAAPSSAIFQNGGFEAGTLANWTQGTGTNPGLTLPQPFTGASIALGSGGTFRGTIVTGGPDLVGAPITLPRVGLNTARVNNADTGAIANFISQSDTITAADRDPIDNLLHIRFSYSVVLEDPGHSPEDQPFFYLRVRNVTKSTTLFEDFSFAGQTGTQFVPVPSSTNYLYLDWKNADVIVPNADLGDTIEVYLLGADCSLGGHSGYAYLDGFGSQVVVPGAATAAVPIMSEWALLLMGTLLLGGAAFTMRRR